MDYIVKGRNVDLNDKIKDYSEKKIKNRIEKFMDRATKIEVKFKIEKNPRISDNKEAEITVFASGSVIRVTDTGSDFFEAIDKAGVGSAEVVTVYYGADVEAAQAEQIAQQIRDKHPEKQVEMVSGGQPHYSYIVSLE